MALSSFCVAEAEEVSAGVVQIRRQAGEALKPQEAYPSSVSHAFFSDSAFSVSLYL